MTSPNLTNVVWVKTILYSYRHIRPKKVKYPIPEIPDDSENKSGMDWVLPKIIGSGRVSGTRQALLTGETAQLHHYLFLLPFLPSILALFAQGSLFQHYVKPETAEDQWYAFLSLFVPVRIFLIKDKEKAFNYYMLSTAVTSFTIICGWVIFTLVLWNLPEEEDSGKGFFIFYLISRYIR